MMMMMMDVPQHLALEEDRFAKNKTPGVVRSGLRATNVVSHSDATSVELYRIDMLLSTMAFIGL